MFVISNVLTTCFAIALSSLLQVSYFHCNWGGFSVLDASCFEKQVGEKFHLPLLVDNAPPAEAGEQPAADVLHHPEVGGEEEGDEDEGGDEGVEGDQVEEDRDQLEDQMKDHHAAMGRSSLPLSDNPGETLKGAAR